MKHKPLLSLLLSLSLPGSLINVSRGTFCNIVANCHYLWFMAAGRPPLFETPDDLQDKIDGYFVSIEGERSKENQMEWEKHPEPPTITGLVLFLGFDSRQSFYDYEKKEEFTYTIKKARLRIENEYEKGLSRQSPTGAIFALKNFGWKDKTETELSGEIALKQITGMEIK